MSQELQLFKNKSELARLDKDDVNEKAGVLRDRLVRNVRALEGEGDNSAKYVVVLNELLGRNYSQNEPVYFDGFESVVDSVSDKTVLLENNIIYGTTQLVGSNTVHVLVDPIDENIAEKITKSISPFENAKPKIPYRLMVFINTEDRNTYEMLLETVQEVVEGEFTLTSTIRQIDLAKKADIAIYKPVLDPVVGNLTNQFRTTFGVGLADRKKKIFMYSSELARNVKSVSITDVMLLATKNFSNLLLEDGIRNLMTKEAAKLWYDVNNDYKFMHETIEDFFDAPNAIILQGVTPMLGLIMRKELKLKGAFIKDDGTEEETNIILLNNNDVLPVTSHFSEYLKLNVKNLRDKLIKYQGQVYRVDSIESKLILSGQSISGRVKVNGYELVGKIDKIFMLASFYSKEWYQKLVKASNIIEFKLPDRFNKYLNRKALMNKFVAEPDTEAWFNPQNRRLGSVLKRVSEVLPPENYLDIYISGEHGLITTEIIVEGDNLNA